MIVKRYDIVTDTLVTVGQDEFNNLEHFAAVLSIMMGKLEKARVKLREEWQSGRIGTIEESAQQCADRLLRAV